MFESIKLCAQSHTSEKSERAWGKSIVLETKSNNKDSCYYREKFLIFKPGASIVLESHSGYDEVWVSDGSFNYILETDEELLRFTAQKYERVVIPRGKKHKIINCRDEELCIFEIQMGKIDPLDKCQFKSEDTKL